MALCCWFSRTWRPFKAASTAVLLVWTPQRHRYLCHVPLQATIMWAHYIKLDHWNLFIHSQNTFCFPFEGRQPWVKGWWYSWHHIYWGPGLASSGKIHSENSSMASDSRSILGVWARGSVSAHLDRCCHHILGNFNRKTSQKEWTECLLCIQSQLRSPGRDIHCRAVRKWIAAKTTVGY